MQWFIHGTPRASCIYAYWLPAQLNQGVVKLALQVRILYIEQHHWTNSFAGQHFKCKNERLDIQHFISAPIFLHITISQKQMALEVLEIAPQVLTCI